MVKKLSSPSIKKLKPTIIPRADHLISRKSIHANALKVLYRLQGAGFEAYLVGGSVRDLLLNRTPKDFDVATNAHPEEIRKLFRNCRLIGRRFVLAHIFFGEDIIEVATFRAFENEAVQHQRSDQGMILRDNIYGTLVEDAWRRDFTVNALYYNIADFSIVDYTGGMKDLKAGILRMIGDPKERYLEDPVRLLRAVRFAAKLNLTLSLETEAPIIQHSHLLEQVSPARLFTETLKFFEEGHSLETFKQLQKYHLLQPLFPETTPLLSHPQTYQLIQLALKNTDDRIREEKSISPAFLFSVFLWPPILKMMGQGKHRTPQNIESIIHQVFKKQKDHLDIPRRLLQSIREICILQHRFTFRRGKQPYRLVDHPRFRAAYDLLLLRAESGEGVHELSHWWTEFYQADQATRERMMKQLQKRK